MHFRLSRLRFVLVRCCCFLIIFLLILELKSFFQTNSDSNKTPKEILFWEQLNKQDKYLTTEQRIEQIKLIEKQNQKNHLNWTKIFYKIYQTKIEKLDQKDMKNIYKHKIIENKENVSQKIFQIFEETPVRLHCSL